MALNLSNVSDPSSLTSYIVTAETIEITAATSGKPFLAVAANGAFGAAGSLAKGVIAYYSEGETYATVVLSGTVPVELLAGVTLLEGGVLSLAADGKAKPAADGEFILGIAKNASTGSTINNPHFTMVEVGANGAKFIV